MTFLTDIRYALRGLWRSRGFALTAMLCLAFGIGLNTTIFSIVDGVLLQPLPFHEPDRLIVFGERHLKSGDEAGLSYPDLKDWQAATTALSALVATSGRNLNVSDDGAGDPERVLGAAVSWNLFAELGVSPIVGTSFREEDDRPGAGGVVLIGYDLWTNRYDADRAIVGRTMHVDGQVYTVAGVMPRGFAFPSNMRLWMPVTPLLHEQTRANRGLFVLGRLKPGVTEAQATTDLSAIAARLAREYPATNEGWTVSTETLSEAFLPGDAVEIILLMMGAVTLVLFVACSNVANLMLVRASVRRREFALRAALGAGQRRIVRQLLTESVVLALVSLPVGLAFAVVGTRLIAGAIPPDQVPYYVRFAVDGRTFLYSVAVAVVTALLFGLFPAMQVTHASLRGALEESARGATTGRSRLRSALVIVQVSLALVSLVGALLFVRTFLNLSRYDLGFDPASLMTIRFSMIGTPYESPDARLLRVRDIVERVEALPGVEAAFGSNLAPLYGGGGGGDIEIDGQPAETGQGAGIGLIGVTPHFVKTMGAPLTLGRDLSDSEGQSRTPVAVVNETMARRFWGQAGAVGRRFRLKDNKSIPEWFTVIGVTKDMRLYPVSPGDLEPNPMAFVSYAYQQSLTTSVTVRVRSGDPAAITPTVREAVRRSDPALPLFQIRTIEEMRRLNFWEFGLYGWIFGTTGVVGLLLASVGVYGVLSYSVEQRAREIGVRVALGAEPRAVLALIVGHGVRLVAIGVAIGLAIAAAAMPWARNQLFGVSPFDPFSFAGVAILLLVVAGLASLVPALRATRVDPVVVLKGE